MNRPGKRPRTHIHRSRKQLSFPRSQFQSGVSIHSHTQFSKENLGFIPHYASRIPWVAGCVRRACEEYRRKHGLDLDFSRAYWTPPVSPEDVWNSETRQIEQALGLPALVSVTDHDSVEAPQSLRSQLPVSLEWTVPWSDGYFHLGVHNVDPGQEEALVTELQRFTTGRSACSVADLLAALHRSPGTLIVFNHPLWDVERSGAEVHRAAMQAFLATHHEFIHAVEINGFRPWQENAEVIDLGQAWTLPVVAGGDRHGACPNTVLNLSTASTLEEFVAEIREDRISDVILMPAYGHCMFSRQFRTTAEAVQVYAKSAPDRRLWADRVFFQNHRGEVLPLNQQMSGVPGWLALVVLVLQGLGNHSLHRVINAVSNAGPFDFPDPEPRRESSFAIRGPYQRSCATLNEESGRQ